MQNRTDAEAQSKDEKTVLTDQLIQLLNTRFHANKTMELIRKGANANTQDQNGNTLIHLITQRLCNPEKQNYRKDYHQMIYELVTKHSANINIKNKTGTTPLKYLLTNHIEKNDILFFSNLGADTQIGNSKSILKKLMKDQNFHSQKIPRSKILINYSKTIGRGSYAEIHEATLDGKKVAFKVAEPNYSFKQQIIFYNEVRIMHELSAEDKSEESKSEENKSAENKSSKNNSHIVAFLGYGFQHNCYLIAMPLIQQGSLFNLFNLYAQSNSAPPSKSSLKAPSIPERINIVWGIADGLNYIHEHGIIHNDIKSQNILLDENNTPKICDFGLSEKVNELRKHKPKGSYFWAAPELFTTAAKNSQDTDVWSFAMTSCETINWKKAADLFQLLKKTRDEQKTELREYLKAEKRPSIPNDTPEEFEKVINLCWSTNPGARPKMKEVLDMLEPIHSSPKCK